MNQVELCPRCGHGTAEHDAYGANDCYTCAWSGQRCATETDEVFRLYAVEKERDELRARLAAIEKLHHDAGESQGYFEPDMGTYTRNDHCCAVCGEHGEYGVAWPCPTVRATRGER